MSFLLCHHSPCALPFSPSPMKMITANIDLFLASTDDEAAALNGVINGMCITSVQAEVLRHRLLRQGKVTPPLRSL